MQEGGGIRSAPTLLHLLQQATAVADRTDLIEPVEDASTRGSRAADDDDPEAAARRRRNLFIGIGVGAGILIVALIVLASVLSHVFGDVGGGLKGDQLGLNPSTSSAPDSAPGDVVKPTRVTVFSPMGGADNPAQADKALADSGWETDVYTDSNPFPNFKNGVGLMLQLPSPTTVGSVSSPCQQWHRPCRSARPPRPTPASLEDTTVLTPPATAEDRHQHHHRHRRLADVEPAGVDLDAWAPPARTRPRSRPHREGGVLNNGEDAGSGADAGYCPAMARRSGEEPQ